MHSGAKEQKEGIKQERTAEAALALIRAKHAIVKNLFASIDADLKKDEKELEGWHYFLSMLADPANNRKVYDHNHRRSEVYDAEKKVWTVRKPSAARGLPKPGATHTKKTATTLLPAHGKIVLFNHDSNGAGVLFDIRKCIIKAKYVFITNGFTWHKWWLKKSDGSINPDIKYENLVIPIDALRRDQDSYVARDACILKHNEILASVAKEALVAIFATKGDLVAPRLNAVHKKILTYEFLKIDLPLLVLAKGELPREYKLNEQIDDLKEAFSPWRETKVARLFANQICKKMPFPSTLGNEIVARHAEMMPLIPDNSRSSELQLGFDLVTKNYNRAAQSLEKADSTLLFATEAWIIEQKLPIDAILNSPLGDLLDRKGKRFHEFIHHKIQTLVSRREFEKAGQEVEKYKAEDIYQLEKRFSEQKMDYSAILATRLGRVLLQKGKTFLNDAIESLEASAAENIAITYGVEDVAKEQIMNVLLVLLRLKRWDSAKWILNNTLHESLFPNSEPIRILLNEAKPDLEVLEYLSRQCKLDEVVAGKTVVDIAIEKDLLPVIERWSDFYDLFNPNQLKALLNYLVIKAKNYALAKKLLQSGLAIANFNPADESPLESLLTTMRSDIQLLDIELIRLMCDAMPNHLHQKGDILLSFAALYFSNKEYKEVIARYKTGYKTYFTSHLISSVYTLLKSSRADKYLLVEYCLEQNGHLMDIELTGILKTLVEMNQLDLFKRILDKLQGLKHFPRQPILHAILKKPILKNQEEKCSKELKEEKEQKTLTVELRDELEKQLIDDTTFKSPGTKDCIDALFEQNEYLYIMHLVWTYPRSFSDDALHLILSAFFRTNNIAYAFALLAYRSDFLRSAPSFVMPLHLEQLARYCKINVADQVSQPTLDILKERKLDFNDGFCLLAALQVKNYDLLQLLLTRYIDCFSPAHLLLFLEALINKPLTVENLAPSISFVKQLSAVRLDLDKSPARENPVIQAVKQPDLAWFKQLVTEFKVSPATAGHALIALLTLKKINEALWLMSVTHPSMDVCTPDGLLAIHVAVEMPVPFEQKLFEKLFELRASLTHQRSSEGSAFDIMLRNRKLPLLENLFKHHPNQFSYDQLDRYLDFLAVNKEYKQCQLILEKKGPHFLGQNNLLIKIASIVLEDKEASPDIVHSLCLLCINQIAAIDDILLVEKTLKRKDIVLFEHFLKKCQFNKDRAVNVDEYCASSRFLIETIKLGWTQFAIPLCNLGALPHIKDREQRSALSIALRGNHHDLVKYFLENYLHKFSEAQLIDAAKYLDAVKKFDLLLLALQRNDIKVMLARSGDLNSYFKSIITSPAATNDTVATAVRELQQYVGKDQHGHVTPERLRMLESIILPLHERQADPVISRLLIDHACLKDSPVLTTLLQACMRDEKNMPPNRFIITLCEFGANPLIPMKSEEKKEEKEATRTPFHMAIARKHYTLVNDFWQCLAHRLDMNAKLASYHCLRETKFDMPVYLSSILEPRDTLSTQRRVAKLFIMTLLNKANTIAEIVEIIDALERLTTMLPYRSFKDKNPELDKGSSFVWKEQKVSWSWAQVMECAKENILNKANTQPIAYDSKVYAFLRTPMKKKTWSLFATAEKDYAEEYKSICSLQNNWEEDFSDVPPATPAPAAAAAAVASTKKT